MNKLKGMILLIVFVILGCISARSQAPAGFPFQSLIKDNQGVIAKNTDAYIKCQIIKGTAAGRVVYEEAHVVKTNEDGIFSIIIGQGTRISGENSLYAIDWGHDMYFLNIKSVIPGSTSIKWYDPSLSYTDIGTTQLWSVPYALYAGNSSQSNLTTANINTTGILTVNGLPTLKNAIVGVNDATISMTPGKANSVLLTDSSGLISWKEIKNTRLVSGVLKIFALSTTATGDSLIQGNTIITTKLVMPEASIGDPVFVTSMDDTIGFGVYSAFVSNNKEITIRFSNYQDVPALITGKRFSVLIVK